MAGPSIPAVPLSQGGGALARRAGLRWLGGLAGASVFAFVAGCGSTPPTRPPPPDYPAATEPAPAHAQAVTLHALGLVGTPYRYGGNTPTSGFDCSGLIGYVYWHAGQMKTPRTVQLISQWGQSVPAGNARTGDLVVFASRGRAASHAGIYVGEGRFVHAPSSGGTVRLDHLASRHWAAQAIDFRRP